MALISIAVDNINRSVTINRAGNRQILPMHDKRQIEALKVALQQIQDLVACNVTEYETMRIKESA